MKFWIFFQIFEPMVEGMPTGFEPPSGAPWQNSGLYQAWPTASGEAGSVGDLPSTHRRRSLLVRNLSAKLLDGFSDSDLAVSVLANMLWVVKKKRADQASAVRLAVGSGW